MVEDEPRARDVSIARDRLIVTLTDSRIVSVPVEWYPRLAHGTRSERNRWELVADGTAIHWPDLDEDLSVDGIIRGRRSMEGPKSFNRWLRYRKRGELPPVPTLPLPDWFNKEIKSTKKKNNKRSQLRKQL